MDAQVPGRQSSEPKISRLRRRRWAGFALCAVVLILGAIVAWKLWPRDGLLDRAEKIADVRDWTGIEYMTGRGPLYNWLTESDVLFFRQDPGKPDLQGYRQTVLPTGKAQPPIKIPGLVAKAFDPTMKAFSAHGNWILQCRYDAQARTEREELVSLKDGSVKRLIDGFMNAGWSEDSRYVVSRLPGKVLLYQPETGVTSRIYLPQVKEFPATPAPRHHGPDYSELLWARPDRALIFVRRWRTFNSQDVATRPYMAPYENTTTLEFALCDLADTDKPIRTWSVPIPGDAIRGNISVLPGGDKLVWSVKIDGTRPLDSLLHRLLPGTFPASRKYFAYRISDLNGANSRELLRYDVQTAPSQMDVLRSGALPFKWMPDGKHLSFVYCGALYRVRVD